MSLVTKALLTAGGLLLVLVAGVSWLVTRQVVTPVRLARRVAERLAAGRLQERLQVSGEDDLARLATSFNQMASNLQRQIRQLEELSRVLATVVPGRIDAPVVDRIVAETRGNPLALLELPRGLSATQLAGGFGLPQPGPLSGRIED